MTRPIVKFHNSETNEITEREMNNDEFAQWELDCLDSSNKKAEAEARATQKAALLERLGISEDEARLLLA
jgi:hypothetical protein